MLQSLLAGIILGGLTVVFALQNVGIVTVQVLMWQISAPLALIVMMSVLGGISITLMTLLPGHLRDAMYLSAIKREKREIENELAELRMARAAAERAAIFGRPTDLPAYAARS